jgi:hypothetical protein
VKNTPAYYDYGRKSFIVQNYLLLGFFFPKKGGRVVGAETLETMTLRIMTSSIMMFSVTVKIHEQVKRH